MSSAVTWRVEGNAGSLLCSLLDGRVSFDDLGVRFVPDRWQDRPTSRFGVLHTGGPTGKSAPLERSDVYVRGADLVATYSKTPPHQISPQIMWCAEEVQERSAVAIEMIISMQTDLLDSSPQAMVSSVAAGAELFHADKLASQRMLPLTDQRFDCLHSTEHLFVLRDAATGLSYAEMVHPSDFVSAEVFYDELSHPAGIQSILFPERLEKGVIRRARICGWFLPAENDLAVAVELARQFVDEPLPLTA